MKMKASTAAVICSIALMAGSAGAQTHAAVGGNANVSAGSSGAVAVSQSGGQNESARISGKYSAFAASAANAQALVSGLHEGRSITLNGRASERAGGDASGSVTFVPPIPRMTYEEIDDALSIARHALAKAKISRPTPQQIHAALIGGAVASMHEGAKATTTLMPGVLKLRSEGRSWANIAQAFGAKLEHGVGEFASDVASRDAAMAVSVAGHEVTDGVAAVDVSRNAASAAISGTERGVSTLGSGVAIAGSSAAASAGNVLQSGAAVSDSAMLIRATGIGANASSGLNSSSNVLTNSSLNSPSGQGVLTLGNTTALGGSAHGTVFPSVGGGINGAFSGSQNTLVRGGLGR